MARTINALTEATSEGVRTPPLVLQIADRLEQEIVSGRYSEGEWLREQEIADRLGTSRGPVREALRLVEQEGFVESVAWRGMRVVSMSRSELDDLLEVVAALQGLVSRLVSAHASDSEIDEIERMIETMETTLQSPDGMPRQLALAFEMGVQLRLICGSRRAGEMLMKVGRLAYWQHRYLLTADKRWRTSAVAKWRRLLAAIRSRNGDRADKAARDMVQHSKAYIMRKHHSGGKPLRVQDLPTSIGRDAR